MIRLLAADDSALMRRLMTDLFAAEGDFEIETARDGAEALERLADKLSVGTGREGIRTALLHHAHVSAQASCQKGCLISTATGELLPDDEEARERVAAYYGRMVQLLADAVRRGQSEGVIDPAQDAQALARYLQTVIQGLRFVAKTGVGESELRAVACAAMAALGPR